MPQLLPVPNPIVSHWLSEPHRLRDFRSTPELPSECDIIIIGSGMAGITTAYFLLHENPNPPNIVLLEARELCTGATGRNGGHSKVLLSTISRVVKDHGPGIATELQTMVQKINDTFKQIINEEKLDCEFELRRSHDVQLETPESEQLKQMYDEGCKAGHEWTKDVSWIGPEHVEQVTSIKGAKSAFSVPACSLWPYKFVSQLLSRLLERHPDHLNFQTNTPVTSVDLQVDTSSVVTTPRGTIKTQKVIFATNAYTSGLLPQFQDIIYPVRGMASHLVPKTPVRPHLSNTYNIDYGSAKGVDYLNPRPDGSIVVGGAKWTFPDRETWYKNSDDSKPFPSEVQSYWDGYMQRVFHGWENSGAFTERVWPGIQGYTPDSWPHVGRVPGTKSQWMLAGFNGGGNTMILKSAETVAKMIREDKEFGDVAREVGVLTLFGTSKERMRKKIEETLPRVDGDISIRVKYTEWDTNTQHVKH
ncbi:FAD dependent oxidoreductase [Lophiostoma macrostomum CBS 122681]|uniref:FAD dependent oxidoreductase n=1 Tax=Lophiostoma macrostomum CBS 122681 TaxID=1314788 RepID=A0A6A6TSW2_9PLEO|nr:FAD dependent oxidoreductase [Lophiostoma macrostomum CBS 122681]